MIQYDQSIFHCTILGQLSKDLGWEGELKLLLPVTNLIDAVVNGFDVHTCLDDYANDYNLTA